MSRLKFRSLFAYLGIIVLLASCKEENLPVKEEDSLVEFSEKSTPDPVWKLETDQTTRVSHVFRQVKYQAKVLPALEFLKRKGEQVATGDKADLAKESVILLEFSSLKQSTADVLKLEQCKLDYEKAIEHLSFSIESDLHIEQKGQVIHPNGIQYEREFNISSKKRILCYFSGVDLESDFKLILNDELFGAGILKYNLKNERYLEKQASEIQ